MWTLKNITDKFKRRIYNTCISGISERSRIFNTVLKIIRKEAKLIRVDKSKSLIYVWRGGEYIDIYTFGDYKNTVAIRDPITTKMPSFTQVKTKMREMMQQCE